MAYKLVCFDVDGTLVDNIEYSWSLFHEYFKVDPKRRKKAKEDFFAGKIAYEEWALHDIGMWQEQGRTRKEFIEAMEASGICAMKGAVETIRQLKQAGMKIAIISGSINILLEYIFPNYAELFDDVYLSRLFFDDQGNITDVKATQYDLEGKARCLKMIAEQEGLAIEECVFIGDHHNDVAVAKEVGLGIAFNAKDDELKRVADLIIDTKDLRDILPCILPGKDDQ